MIAQYKRAHKTRNVDQLAQWRAQDCNQLRDCGVATHRGPKLYSHYNDVDIESTYRATSCSKSLSLTMEVATGRQHAQVDLIPCEMSTRSGM